MFLLQPPTITAPTGQMPTQQVPQQAPQDDAISRFLNKPAASKQQSQQPTTKRSAVDEYLGSGHSHSTSSASPSTSEVQIDMPKNNPLRKVVTFSTDVSATARAVKFVATVDPASKVSIAKGVLTSSKGTGWFTQCLNWAGTKIPALGHLTKLAPAVKWMGLAGKAMPYIGGVLAVADVAVDYSNAKGVKGAAGILEEKLASSGLTPEQITKAQEIANKGIHQGKVEAELRQHLLAHEVQNADEIIALAKDGQKARDAAFSSAHTNAALTGSGAAIGAVIGGLCGVGVFSVPGAILGACIGAGVGNLVNFVGQKTGLFSAIGSFFS